MPTSTGAVSGGDGKSTSSAMEGIGRFGGDPGTEAAMDAGGDARLDCAASGCDGTGGEGERVEEADELPATEGATEEGEACRDSRTVPCRTIFASTKSGVLKSAEMTRKLVSMSLAEVLESASDREESKDVAHSTGMSSPVERSQHVSLTMSGGVMGRRSWRENETPT